MLRHNVSSIAHLKAEHYYADFFGDRLLQRVGVRARQRKKRPASAAFIGDEEDVLADAVPRPQPDHMEAAEHLFVEVEEDPLHGGPGDGDRGAQEDSPSSSAPQASSSSSSSSSTTTTTSSSSSSTSSSDSEKGDRAEQNQQGHAADSGAPSSAAPRPGPPGQRQIRSHAWGPFTILYRPATPAQPKPAFEATCFAHAKVGKTMCKKTLLCLGGDEDDEDDLDATRLMLYAWCNEALKHKNKGQHGHVNPRKLPRQTEAELEALRPTREQVEQWLLSEDARALSCIKQCARQDLRWQGGIQTDLLRF